MTEAKANKTVEEILEAMAMALYALSPNRLVRENITIAWNDLKEGERECYRAEARAALTALAGELGFDNPEDMIAKVKRI